MEKGAMGWVGVGVGVHSGKKGGTFREGFSRSFLLLLSESSYLNYLVSEVFVLCRYLLSNLFS